MSKADRRKEKVSVLAKTEERKRFTLRVLQACSDTSNGKLAELAATGVVPPCGPGCSHCCRLEVSVSRAESEVVVDWLLANRSAEELEGIRDRLRAWLVWYRTEYHALIASGVSRVDAFAKHGPLCALNVDGSCSVYPVRPALCRNYHVSSPVSDCDPTTSTREPEPIYAVLRAVRVHVHELQDFVASQGGDYFATIHLINEWLAHLLEVEREPWQGAPRPEIGRSRR
jgi:hypothetical protein